MMIYPKLEIVDWTNTVSRCGNLSPETKYVMLIWSASREPLDDNYVRFGEQETIDRGWKRHERRSSAPL